MTWHPDFLFQCFWGQEENIALYQSCQNPGNTERSRAMAAHPRASEGKASCQSQTAGSKCHRSHR